MQTAGEKAFVDYMGAKGKIDMQNEEIKINPKKLYMSGFPIGTTPLQVQSLFEKCSKVTIPKSRFLKGKSYGLIFFNNESDAKAAFESAQNMKIGGADVTVVFSKVLTHGTIETDKKSPLPPDNDKENQLDGSPSKKQNIDKKEKIEEQKQEDKKEKCDNVEEVIKEMKTSITSEDSKA